VVGSETPPQRHPGDQGVLLRRALRPLPEADNLYGPVVVRRKGDILSEKQFTVVFNDMTINNRSGADTPNFEATVGDRVEIIMITHGE
jgi:hypothetical protein